MARIFISYRRIDSRTISGRIYDRLVSEFGRTEIFKDVDNIPAGSDFREVISGAVVNSDVMLVVIGPRWINILQERREDQEDWVRLELLTALQQDQMVIIPLLVDAAGMPAAAELTAVHPDLRELAYKNATIIRDDPDFHRDMARLTDKIRELFPPEVEHKTTPEPRRKPNTNRTLAAVVSGTVVFALLLITLINGLQQNTRTNATPTTSSAAQNATEIPTTEITPSETISPTLNPTQTFTPSPTLSQTEVEETVQAALQGVLAEFTQTAEVLQITEAARIQAETATAAANLTATATLWTQTPTIDARGLAFARLTETQSAIERQGTQDVFASATAQSAARTATATLWTATPTVDVRGTANARLTETQAVRDDRATQDAIASATGFALDQTATATVWTQTPTIDATGTTRANLAATLAAIAGTANAHFTETQVFLDSTPTTSIQMTQTQVRLSASTITSVCLVTDVGRVNDGSFNQSAYNGIVRAAEEFGLTSTYIETQNQADYAANIDTCIADGYQIVVTVGFLIADATRAAAEANPGIYFIGVDLFFAEPVANLVGIQFREDQAGFLAGVIAGLMTESNIVGGVYGVEIPPGVKFRHGFEQGVRYISPDATILGVYIGSFVAPAEGAAAAESFIGEGADVIFGAGGSTGSGGILRAAELGVKVIGVDQDEFLTTFGNGSTPGAEYLITSAMKRVDEGVYQMINALVVGDYTFPDTSLYLMDATVDGIGFAPANLADVPAEVTARAEEVFEMLKSGELSTGVDPVTGELLEPINMPTG